MTTSRVVNRLIKQFIAVAGRVDTSVEVIPKSPEALKNALLKATGGSGSVALAEPDDLDPALFDLYKNFVNIPAALTDVQLSKIAYGVSDAFAGIARTGSVCVSMTEKMGGAYSLFCRVHIAVLEAKNMLARPRDVFEKEPFRSIAMRRDFVFVSGSSATADMGPLVRGVHGPAKLHVIILE